MTLSPANNPAAGYPLGLAGAQSGTRFVGGTASGAPVSGTFAVGDFVVAQDGSVYICTAAGSPGSWVAVSGGGGESELAYAEITSDVTVTSTTEATPDNVVSSGAVDYDGSRICVEGFASVIGAGAGGGSYLTVNLWDANTDLGRVARVGPSFTVTPMYFRAFLTPSAGSHTYRLRSWAISSQGGITASSPSLPAYVRVSSAPAAA